MEFDRTKVYNLEGAMYAMRMPYMSHDQSDSYWDEDNNYIIGNADMKLALKLIRGGSEHAKLLRTISADTAITAPQYWIAEMQTYKIGTICNSSSLQHKGASRDFTIRDFTVEDKRVYDILDPPVRDFNKENPLTYPYETEEYKIFKSPDTGREYKIYKNGKIFACAFEYRDNFKSGRDRHYPEKEVMPFQVRGYWAVRIDGRLNKHYMVHRLVAMTWLKDTYKEGLEVNHKNKNRGDNSVENLEWVTRAENEAHKRETYKAPLYVNYKTHLNFKKYDGTLIFSIVQDKKNMSYDELSKKYGLSVSALQNIIYKYNHIDDKQFLYDYCDFWRETIDTLNDLRKAYIETKDYKYFRMMRQLMPMGYNYTYSWSTNYAQLRNMWLQRVKNPHRLKEWTVDFAQWIDSLPYADQLIKGGEQQ